MPEDMTIPEDSCNFDFAAIICQFIPMIRMFTYILLCLLTLIFLFSCDFGNSSKTTESPQQIPIPDELAQTPVTPPAPGHLEYLVERSTKPVAKRPFGISLSPDGKRAYLASAEKGEIVVVDVDDLDIEVTWGPFGEYLFATIPSDDGKHVFAYGLGGEHLFAIDAETGRLKKTFSVGRNISDAIVGPDNTLLVASTIDKRVTIIDQVTLKKKGKITFSHPIGYIAVGLRGEIACATGGVYSLEKGRSHAKSGPVSFFDPSVAGKAIQADVLKLSPHARDPVFVDGDKYLLVPDRVQGTVSIFDVSKRRLIKQVDVGQGPEKILRNPRWPEAYSIDTLGRSVSVVSIDPFETTRQIPLPANPEFGVISPDGKFLYVTLPASSLVNNRIAVIDLKKKHLVDLIPTGKDPCRMVLSQDGRTLFVTNFLGNTLSIIR